MTSSLNNLYAQNEATTFLVFPEIKKAAFFVGAQYGYGALRNNSKMLGYYRIRAVSYAFQAGVKQFGYALFFTTDSALEYLDKSGGLGQYSIDASR